MVDKKTWEEFRNSGLLWWINMILHTFGWSICVNMEGDKIVDAYPARVKYRGFSGDINDKGYNNVTKYLNDNINELLKESEL